jgi:hypothetical protein
MKVGGAGFQHAPPPLISPALPASQHASSLRLSLSAVSFSCSGLAQTRTRNHCLWRSDVTLLGRLPDEMLMAESRRPEGGGGLRAKAKPERADKLPKAAC